MLVLTVMITVVHASTANYHTRRFIGEELILAVGDFSENLPIPYNRIYRRDLANLSVRSNWWNLYWRFELLLKFLHLEQWLCGCACVGM